MAKRRQSPPPSAPVTSSTPPRLPRKQESLFREVLTLLEKNKVPLAVSGAFALRQHTGICRDTKDLDIFLPAEEISRGLECLMDAGFECEVSDPVWLAKAHRDGYFVDLITGMSNAVIVVDASWIARAEGCEVLGVETRQLAPEELIASKLFVTRRERFDGADIAHVVYAAQGRLDWGRISNLVGEHWEILLWALVLFHYVYPGCGDYVPADLWRDLLRRFTDSLAHPGQRDQFRGSLIDPCMFAIDINERGLEDRLSQYRDRREPLIVLPHKAGGAKAAG
ncbi:MAG TPA: nucleotidyltransferase [Candidatus Binatia bacterium]|nr:nucleotidyltransferase [Candidatus Binatia bacterium]